MMCTSALEDLHTASNLLGTALGRYIASCSAIANCYYSSNTLKCISQTISDVIINELELIASYEAKLKRAKAAINQARNIIPTIVHINTLPPDVLTHIFQLVAESEHSSESPLPTYSEILSHVCAHWRQIAISSRRLWSRISIIPSQGNVSNGRFARAEIFAARAGSSPLDLYIIDPSEAPGDIRVDAFCASIATRIRSLDLSVKDARLSVLQSNFVNCTPGTLSELAIQWSSSKYAWNMIEASENPVNRDNQLLEVPHRYLEDRLLPVRILRLSGIYFPWTSWAYHGLVELHLLPIYDQPTGAPITQSQLVGILANSPSLRVLRFGLDIDLDIDIDEVPPHNSSFVPMHLNDLEELDLRPMSGAYCEDILRVLSPGSKPLRLSLWTSEWEDPIFPQDGVKKFFARSYIAELHIRSIDSNSHLDLSVLELFGLLHMPWLRKLSLANFYLDEHADFEPQDHQPPASVGANGPGLHPISPRLNALHLTHCTFELVDLQILADVLPIQALNLASCITRSEGDPFDEAEVLKQRVAEVVPAVKFLSVPWALNDWDPWN